MSLLGFDAIGRSALGQLPRSGPTNTVLLASMGGYTVTGPNAYTVIRQASSGVPFMSAGYTALMRVAFAVLLGSDTFAGNSVTISVRFSTNAGNTNLTGAATKSSTLLSCLGVSCIVVGPPGSFKVSLLSAASSYGLAGYSTNVTRDHEAWFPLPLTGDAWISESVEAMAWTDRNPATQAWMAQTPQTKTWTPATTQPETWIVE